MNSYSKAYLNICLWFMYLVKCHPQFKRKKNHEQRKEIEGLNLSLQNQRHRVRFSKFQELIFNCSVYNRSNSQWHTLKWTALAMCSCNNAQWAFRAMTAQLVHAYVCMCVSVCVCLFLLQNLLCLLQIKGTEKGKVKTDMIHFKFIFNKALFQCISS